MIGLGLGVPFGWMKSLWIVFFFVVVVVLVLVFSWHVCIVSEMSESLGHIPKSAVMSSRSVSWQNRHIGSRGPRSGACRSDSAVGYVFIVEIYAFGGYHLLASWIGYNINNLI